uniref:MSP domain-containing protein n=1 Tax=Panagrellus redivivus TaxID=6233 RepID=A0A7E4VGD9_PANRE
MPRILVSQWRFAVNIQPVLRQKWDENATLVRFAINVLVENEGCGRRCGNMTSSRLATVSLPPGEAVKTNLRRHKAMILGKAVKIRLAVVCVYRPGSVC